VENTWPVTEVTRINAGLPMNTLLNSCMGGDLPLVSRSVPLDKACAIEVQMDGFSVPDSRSVSDQMEGVQCRYLPATIKTETVILSRILTRSWKTLTAKWVMFSALFL
jgi:hypothetical protein